MPSSLDCRKSSMRLLEVVLVTHVAMGALALALGIAAAGVAGTAAISSSMDSKTTTVNALQKEKEPSTDRQR